MKPKKNEKPFAKKSFGQNFLVDRNIIEKIITALDPNPGETIIEIGAGRGALTEKLIESGATVVAIELERNMISVLKERFSGAGEFRLIEQDALKVDFAALGQREDQRSKPKLVANLPYYISTAILQKLIQQRAFLTEMILMFQREVVERITAAPGSRERGFLTVLAEAYLETEKLFDVPPTAFRPAPKVWSAVVRVKPKSEVPIENDELFRATISAAFRQKRKTILNNLKDAEIVNADWLKILKEAEVEPNRRAESLTLVEWVQIHAAFLRVKTN